MEYCRTSWQFCVLGTVIVGIGVGDCLVVCDVEVVGSTSSSISLAKQLAGLSFVLER